MTTTKKKTGKLAAVLATYGWTSTTNADGTIDLFGAGGVFLITAKDEADAIGFVKLTAAETQADGRDEGRMN